jgi:MFS family permease
VVFALIEGHVYGWTSTLIVACLAGGVIGLLIFVGLEATRRRPMLDLSLFRDRTFTGSNIVAMVTMLTIFGVLFFASIYFQEVLGYSAIETGATFLPLTLVFMAISPLAARLADRVGFRWPVTVGMALLALGLFMFSRLGLHSSFWEILPALIVGGVGMGISSAPVTAAAMVSTPLDKAGVGAGVLVTFRQTGAALGVAILGAIVAAQLGELTPGAPGFPEAFVTGLQHALVAASALALLGVLAAATLIRGARRAPPLETAKEGLARSMAVTTFGGVPAPTAVENVIRREQALAALAAAPALIVENGPLAGKRIPVVGSLSVGRQGKGLRIDDPEISRVHAVLRAVDGAYEIVDLGSRNGTFVNGEPIEGPRRLANGDLVRLGQTSLRVDVPATPPSPRFSSVWTGRWPDGACESSRRSRSVVKAPTLRSTTPRSLVVTPSCVPSTAVARSPMPARSMGRSSTASGSELRGGSTTAT